MISGWQGMVVGLTLGGVAVVGCAPLSRQARGAKGDATPSAASSQGSGDKQDDEVFRSLRPTDESIPHFGFDTKARDIERNLGVK